MVVEYESSPLHLAIASCDLSCLAAILRDYEPDRGDFVPLNSAFNPLELALGWIPGMKLLLESGQEPFSALHLAIKTRDISSFTFLTTNNAPLFVDKMDASKFGISRDNSLALVRLSDCIELASRYIDALKHLRRGLKQLAV